MIFSHVCLFFALVIGKMIMPLLRELLKTLNLTKCAYAMTVKKSEVIENDKMPKIGLGMVSGCLE